MSQKFWTGLWATSLLGGLVIAGIIGVEVFNRLPVTSKTTNVQAFIAQCANLTSTSDSDLAKGYAYCSGKVRGWAEGHELTVRLAAEQNAQVTAKQLWCIDARLSDKQVFDSVVVWINANPAEYRDITKEFPGPNSSLAVVIKALHTTYPCTAPK